MSENEYVGLLDLFSSDLSQITHDTQILMMIPDTFTTVGGTVNS